MEEKNIMSGQTVPQSADDLETWENVTQARFVIKRIGAKGDLIDEMIGSRKRFHLTTQERRINMEIAANEELDPFTNGSLSPVRLLDSTEDAEQIAANPNLMNESDMKNLVKANVKTLQKRLAEVGNPVVVERLLEIANETDSTIGRVQAIEARLHELSPSLYSEVTSTSINNQ